MSEGSGVWVVRLWKEGGFEIWHSNIVWSLVRRRKDLWDWIVKIGFGQDFEGGRWRV